jgi:DNA polymerase-3 subunit gamma/tau
VQRFDFKLSPARLIAQRLEAVLKAEGIRHDEAALSIIAREAAGSMRDAMSLLDQVIAWRPDGLEGDSVALVLGIASRKVLHDLGRALVSHNAEQCLRIVNQLANQGFDLSHVARDFLGLLRDVVVAKACENSSDLLDLPDTEKNDVLALASDTNLDDLVRLHQGFSGGFDDVVRSGQPRSALEMLLVRLAGRPPLLPIDELLNRLGALEHRFLAASGRTSPARGAPPPRAAATPERSVNSTPARGRSREIATPATRHPAGKDSDRDEEPAPARESAATTATPTRTPADTSSEETLLLGWQELVDKIAEARPEMAAVLEHAVPLHVDSTTLHIAWPPGSTLDKQFTDAEFTRVIANAWAASGTVTITHDCREVTGRATLAAVETANRTRRVRELVQKSRQDPCIRLATEILGAHVRDVRVPQDLK